MSVTTFAFVIRNFDDLEWVLKRLEQLYDAQVGSDRARELIELANAIIRYENSIARVLVQMDGEACF